MHATSTYKYDTIAYNNLNRPKEPAEVERYVLETLVLLTIVYMFIHTHIVAAHLLHGTLIVWRISSQPQQHCKLYAICLPTQMECCGQCRRSCRRRRHSDTGPVILQTGVEFASFHAGRSSSAVEFPNNNDSYIFL